MSTANLPPSGGLTNAVIAEWARRIQLLCTRLPTAERGDLYQLWRAIRDFLTAHVREIQQPSRPSTSNSVMEFRDRVGLLLDQSAVEITNASETIRSIQGLRPGWAQDMVDLHYRIPGETRIVQSTGCCISLKQPSHKGYHKLNLRNTWYREQGQADRLISAQPFLHQLVVVGKGEGLRLPLTSGPNAAYHVGTPY